MRLLPKAFLPVALASAMHGAAPVEVDDSVPFRAIRTQDQLMLSVGTSFVTFNETIVLTPIGLKERLQPGKPNLFHLLIPPLWRRDGAIERPAFSTLRPYYSSSHGRVRRLALLRPNGERVLTPDQITPDCRYVLSLEFGHVIPATFTVNVGFTSTNGIEPGTEFLYNPSNDGYPVRSGEPGSVLTDLRVNAEPPLQPWKVMLGDRVLPPASPNLVRMDRELNHVIKFGPE